MVHWGWQALGSLVLLRHPSSGPRSLQISPSVPRHPCTCEADGGGGRAESSVYAGDRVPYEATQYSVIQTQAAAGVVRHHFAEQVPAAGERELSARPEPWAPGRDCIERPDRRCLPVLEPHHGDLRARLPVAQTGCRCSRWWPMGS